MFGHSLSPETREEGLDALTVVLVLEGVSQEVARTVGLFEQIAKLMAGLLKKRVSHEC